MPPSTSGERERAAPTGAQIRSAAKNFRKGEFISPEDQNPCGIPSGYARWGGGGLMVGASLKPADFVQIINAANQE